MSAVFAEPVIPERKTPFTIEEESLMSLVESNLLEKARQAKEPVDQIILHILEAGGKRLRPRLAVACASYGKPHLPDLISTAVSLELIHMASLIHDDIIDESKTRRGRRAINDLWGNQTAVLAGDYLFSTAFHLLCSSRLYQVLEVLTKAVGLMCEGEINQAANAFNLDYSQEAYYECIFRKTACLFAASCQAGALVAGCSPTVSDALYRYGLNLGYAYQILDDILDLVADAEMLGKPTGSDLSRGLITLPTLLLLQDDMHGPWLKQLLTNREAVSEYLVELRERLGASGALRQSLERFSQHTLTAETALAELPMKNSHYSLKVMVDRLSFELAKYF